MITLKQSPIFTVFSSGAAGLPNGLIVVNDNYLYTPHFTDRELRELLGYDTIHGVFPFVTSEPSFCLLPTYGPQLYSDNTSSPLAKYETSVPQFEIINSTLTPNQGLNSLQEQNSQLSGFQAHTYEIETITAARTSGMKSPFPEIVGSVPLSECSLFPNGNLSVPNVPPYQASGQLHQPVTYLSLPPQNTSLPQQKTSLSPRNTSLPPQNTNQIMKKRGRKRPKLNTKTESLNQRSANIENFDASRYYRPISKIPSSWGALTYNGEHIFRYNEYGELMPQDKFTPSQIRDYLYHHPLNFTNGHYSPQNSKLILRVQNTPADSFTRYPNEQSDKCRFVNCPVNKGTILKGSFRIAFDEQGGKNMHVDPYHCAGFVHLYCIERFCDFQHICKNLRVQPDDRVLLEGKNAMAITRDRDEMLPVVTNFIANPPPTITEHDYERTLCYELTSKYLELEPERRRSLREERGGNNIGVHKGDLEKWLLGKETIKKTRVGAQLQTRKRKREREPSGMEEEEEI